jgi:uncharacterized membrane protein HdeD (DUF308 family)
VVSGATTRAVGPTPAGASVFDKPHPYESVGCRAAAAAPSFARPIHEEAFMTAAAPAPTVIRRSAAPWFIVEGVLLIVLGALAAALPALAGVAGALVFGWVLVLAGVFGLGSVLGARRHAHLVFGIVSALIALAVGLLIVWRPLIGAVTLAIFIAAYLLLDGVALIGLAWDQRKRAARGWGWLMASGVVDVVLAILVLALGPISSAVLLGFIIAIDLAIAGIALVTLGWHARHAT